MEVLSQLQARAQLRVGQVLGGKYRLETLLGVGGMGAVFGARSTDGRAVAVKLLHSELAQVKSLATRFVREAYVANHIAHPGVPQVYEHGEDENGAPFIVMELLMGETLEDRWERRGHRLGVGEVLAIAERLLEVLGAAHTKGIVHRDVKPENVFLTYAADLKVLDFGIARLLDSSGATASGEMMGTPAFMPPEQAGGHSKTADGRADIWAVGAVMFTMISGEHVHSGRTSAIQLIYAATQHARSLATVAPDAPVALVRIVDRALMFDRAARWDSAETMLARIRAISSESIPPTILAPVVGPAATGPTIVVGEMSLHDARESAPAPLSPGPGKPTRR